MVFRKKGKAVNKSMKGYSTQSILERNIYSKPTSYKLKFTNRSIMEIAIYNPTVQEKKGLWEKAKEKMNMLVKREL